MMSEGFGMGLGGGFMWLFWILIAVAVVWVLNGIITGRQTPSDRTRTALEILEERYARGEIGQDEFKQKKADLTG